VPANELASGRELLRHKLNERKIAKSLVEPPLICPTSEIKTRPLLLSKLAVRERTLALLDAATPLRVGKAVRCADQLLMIFTF
jgi:hypothetical protein